MNLTLYKQTDLEMWIYDVYIKNGINNRSDLTLKNVAEAFNCDVEIWDKQTKAVCDEEFGTIFLNNELRGESRREAFFHELGHPFLHVGNQLNMPQEFNDYQEDQANMFQLYASMPMYMIKQLEIPRTEIQFIELLSWEFDVSLKLANKRMNQIKRRIYQAHSDRMLAAQINLQKELLWG